MFRTGTSSPFLAVYVYDDGKADAYDEMLTQMGVGVRLRPHRLGHLERPRGGGVYVEKLRYAAKQLLHQRQVDQHRGRPAALSAAAVPPAPTTSGAPQNLMRWTLTRAIKGDAGRADRLHVPAHGADAPWSNARRARSRDLARRAPLGSGQCDRVHRLR